MWQKWCLKVFLLSLLLFMLYMCNFMYLWIFIKNNHSTNSVKNKITMNNRWDYCKPHNWGYLVPMWLLQEFERPHVCLFQEFRETNRRSPMFNHLSGVSEAIPALGWVAVVRLQPQSTPLTCHFTWCQTFHVRTFIICLPMKGLSLHGHTW